VRVTVIKVDKRSFTTPFEKVFVKFFKNWTASQANRSAWPLTSNDPTIDDIDNNVDEMRTDVE